MKIPGIENHYTHAGIPAYQLYLPTEEQLLAELKKIE
jgi:hypothetical protein